MTTVLIIEDEKHIRQNVAELLAYEDFNTLEASNGRMGVQLAQEHLPDLIICDIMMPELDGYEVLLHLRNDALTATIPFIFLTAQKERPEMRRGMELGADDYLTKPFTPREVIKAVTSRLEKHALLTKEYEQKFDELRGHLIRTLPHELRTPLTGIMGYAEWLSMDGEPLSQTQVKKMATAIYQSGQRLLRLVENYLLYAQIEIIRSDPKRIKEHWGHILESPAEVIESAAREVASQAERLDDLLLDVDNRPIRISNNNLQIIVKELVDNALKFSKKGTQVDIKAYVEDDVFRLSIYDRGRGMSPGQIKAIGTYMQFERKLYEQQGSGLGLMIAKRLAEIHRGNLTIESNPHQLTMVQVTLPLA